MSRLFTSRWLALAVAGGVLTACGENNATGPASDARATLSISTIGLPVVSADAQGYPTISCLISIDAQSVGSTNLLWTDGVFRFYAGTDRKTPIDSQPLGPQQVHDMVGGAEAGKGAHGGSTYSIAAGVPFDGELELRYTSAKVNAPHSVSSRFSCGPKPDSTIAKPTVSIDDVTIDSPPLQPGGLLLVTFTVNSSYTLWRSTVGISGPCEASVVLNEQLAHTATHTVPFRIPAGCTLGTPLTVYASVLDGALQEGSISRPPTLFVSDVTPPTLTASYDVPGTVTGAGTNLVDGGGHVDYFAGDTMVLHAQMTDNGRLRALVWEVQPAGVRDSLVINGDSVANVVAKIPVSAAWGSFQLRVYARDAGGNTSPVIASAVGGFTVHAAVSLPTTIVNQAGGYDAAKMLYDDRSDRLFLLSGNGSQIFVYSGTTLAVQQTISLGFEAADFDITPGGDTLVTVMSGYTDHFDLFDLTGATPQVQSIPAGRTVYPASLLLLGNGHVLMEEVESSQSPPIRLLELDLPALTVRDRTSEGASVLAGRSGDRSVAYLMGNDASGACAKRFDAATDSFGSCARDVADSSLSTTTSGDLVAVGDRLYDPSFQLLRTAAFPNPPWGWSGPPRLSADGATLYRGYPSGVVRARVSDGTLLDLVRLPFAPYRMAISADGATLFAARLPSYVYHDAPKLARISLR